jgi:hypothetical protein
MAVQNMKVLICITALVFRAHHANGKNSSTFRYLAALLYFISLITYLAPQDAMAQAEVIQTGNWDDASTWDGGNIGDVVTENVDIPKDPSIDTVTVQAGTTFTIGILTMGNSNTLIVTGTLDVGSDSDSLNMICDNSDNILVDSNGTLTIWGSLDVRNNLELTINGDFTVKGDVILDNGASLIINGTAQIDGDFSSGSGSTLTVNGGGSFGVSGYFNSNGIDITLAAGGSLYVGLGFDVAQNSTISGDGEASIGNGECSGPDEFCLGSILPVELISFESYFDSDGVLLRWATASELDNEYFSVERSEDGKTFYEIGKVMGNGTSNIIQEYDYKDMMPIASNLEYYRLKQVDYDGAYEYSAILVEVFDDFQANSYEIYPNPATSIINIKMPSSRHFPNMQMINSSGQTVAIITVEDMVTSFDISNHHSGIYYLYITEAHESNVHKLIIK